MSKEVKRYNPLIVLARNAILQRMDIRCDPQWVLDLAAERDALLAERDRMAKALKKIKDAECKSSPTATDFGISWDRGMLIGTMKDIARAALSGESNAS